MATGRGEAARRVIEDHVKKSYANQEYQEAWRNLPEIPSRIEILPTERVDASDDDEEDHIDKPYGVSLPINIVNGPWSSKDAYIAAHYRILREDAIGSLRESVAMVKAHPNMEDDQTTCIYTHVYFKGVQASSQGLGFRVEFSYERAGKRIRWEQSKRLQQGTLVALTPRSDSFKSICKMATIAARPIKGGLDQNPPSVDLFWGDPNEAEFQPGEQYMMVESRTGYFEASRHMLVALQKLMTETFPLQRHIVKVKRDVKPPEYVQDQPLMAMNSLRETTVPNRIKDEIVNIFKEDTTLDNINVLEEFPKIPDTGLDASQTAALRRMLNKRLAIIQGPPGTGKTYVSVAALVVLLENWTAGDAPIIVAAQTNHALDQLLNHIKPFMPDFVRLGSRGDKENVDIQERTLYNLRLKSEIRDGRRSMNAAFAQLKDCIQALQLDLAPVLQEDPALDVRMHDRGILTTAQFESLQDDSWVTAEENRDAPNRLYSWLGQGQLVPIPKCPPIDMGLEEEEIDLEFEQLQELEMEAGQGPDDNDQDALRGTWIPFHQEWTGRRTPGWSIQKMRKYLASKQNLWDVPENFRGEVFRYLWKELYRSMRQSFRTRLNEYSRAIQRIKIERDVSNASLVHQLGIKLIGCTTTGLSKYRGFLAGLMPRAMLIEEAAETLEGTITAAMFETLEHLILVGDHQQLQAHGNIQILQREPYNLNISLFERMMMNCVEFTMLNRQRRMIPDIRKLLCTERSPFYRDLQDHPFVLDRITNRPPVEGMGGKDTYFFGHNWPESLDNDASRSNVDEAQMITGLFNYLVLNGVDPAKITVLTFYNGQRKLILRCLKRHPDLAIHTYFKVFTVDSYQGEENDIILLSLVRSNNYLNIGFLENQNRLVVALSRARRGLYIFGNPVTLTAKEPGRVLFDPIIESMGRQGNFNVVNEDGSPAQGLPITCSNHGKVVEIFEAADWENNNGGCDRPCGAQLPCGHDCYAKCHPFDHEIIQCKKPCTSLLSCGHQCKEYCGARCRCHECELRLHELQQPKPPQLRDITWPGPLNSTLPSPIKGHRVQSKSGSPTKDSQKSYQSAQNSWNSWDAQKADEELEIERQLHLASLPKYDTVIKETYRPAVVRDGIRLVSSSNMQRTIDIGSTSKDAANDSHQNEASKVLMAKEVDDDYFNDIYDASDRDDDPRPGGITKVRKENVPAAAAVKEDNSTRSPVDMLTGDVSFLDLDRREPPRQQVASRTGQSFVDNQAFSSRPDVDNQVAQPTENHEDEEDLISFD